jgi:hypothetical protein
MKITRKVILDLLPLYAAKEASEDTTALVDEYLKSDPELAEIAKNMATLELPGDAPAPLTQEDEMDAYKEAKRKLLERTIILAAIIASSVIAFGVLAFIALMFFRG